MVTNGKGMAGVVARRAERERARAAVDPAHELIELGVLAGFNMGDDLDKLATWWTPDLLYRNLLQVAGTSPQLRRRLDEWVRRHPTEAEAWQLPAEPWP